MRRTVALAVAGVGFLWQGVVPVLAQSEPPKPPPILSIYREQVKPGKGGAHEKNELAWVQALAKAKAPAHYIAMTSVTGPDEAWFIEARDSFASVQKDQEAIMGNAALSAEIDAITARDGELLTASSHMLAVRRDDLGYRVGGRDIAKMRYVAATTIHVKPGYERDFVAFRKVVNEAHEKANMDEQWSAWEVISGAPSGTFLIFQPLASMAEMDGYRDMHGKEYQETMGEDNRARMRDLTREAIQSSTNQVFAFNPKMSHVTAEFAARDPEFWTPKPAAETKKK